MDLRVEVQLKVQEAMLVDVMTLLLTDELREATDNLLVVLRCYQLPHFFPKIDNSIDQLRP